MTLWHCGGCLNKRAARLRLAVQAPAITTTYDDQMIIQYNSPLKASSDECRDFSFYQKQLKMAYVRQNKKELQYRKFTVELAV